MQFTFNKQKHWKSIHFQYGQTAHLSKEKHNPMAFHFHFVFERLWEQKRSINLRCFLDFLSCLWAVSALVSPIHSSQHLQASCSISCKHHPHLPENPRSVALPGRSQCQPQESSLQGSTNQQAPQPPSLSFPLFQLPIQWDLMKQNKT